MKYILVLLLIVSCNLNGGSKEETLHKIQGDVYRVFDEELNIVCYYVKAYGDFPRAPSCIDLNSRVDSVYRKGLPVTNKSQYVEANNE